MAEIKTILNNSRLSCEAYNCASAQTAAFRDSLTSGRGIRYDNDGGTHKHNGNPYERALCKLADMEAECSLLWGEMISNQASAALLILTVPDKKQREVLHQRYINYRSWGQVGRIMNISKRHVLRLHGDALRYLSENT